jgi:hypothetical protein
MSITFSGPTTFAAGSVNITITNDAAAIIAAVNTRLDQLETHTMGALEDLQATDADLAAAVTDLTGAVDRIDADFAALEQAVQNGVDPAAIQAEVTKVRAAIDAAKQAKTNIDTTDPAPAQPTA